MRVSCLRNGLLTACQVINQVIPSRTSIPVYKCIKAIAEGSKLILMGTDLEVGIRYELHGVHIEEAGQAILATDRLINILREAGEGDILIDADERRVKMTLNNSEYEMPSADPATFADVSPFEPTGYYELAAGDLQRMIRRTTFAVSKEEGKFAMRSVLWDTEGNKAKLVATDSKRLALAMGNMVVQGIESNKNQSYLIPPKAFTLVERVLAEGDASQAVQVAMKTNEAMFQTEKAIVTCRLSEGRFPPYRDVIPKKYNARIPLVVDPFYSAVKQAAIMADEEARRIRLNFSAGKLSLDAQGSTTGKSTVTMPLDYSGTPIVVNFDPVFITELLRVLDPSETILLDLVDGSKSAVFRSGEDYLYLVVPLT
ncbi:MAG: DNA polymerase III subunit beta [Gemmataceae bacterium]|nr:DNA polymerase III subunit beta [Gemmataceae bacterium]